MLMINRVVALAIIVTLLSVQCHEEKHPAPPEVVKPLPKAKDTALILPRKDVEEQLHRLSQLPEVLRYEKALQKAGRTTVYMFPDSFRVSDRGVCVKVGEDNGSTYHTQFNFFLSRDLTEIKYLDTFKDSLLTLQEWRKTRKYE